MKTRNTLVAAAVLALAGSPAFAQNVAAPKDIPAPPVAVKDKTQQTPRLNPVVVRAERLSDRMTRELRLNGYQANRLRAINEDKIAKMAVIERKNAGNEKLIDEQCGEVCKERDRELRAVLSNDQYTSYYGLRSAYYKYDRDYVNNPASILLTKSVQDPAPVRTNDAVIGPDTKAAGGSSRGAK